MTWLPLIVEAMSEEQLARLLARLRDDQQLREKLKGAADMDAAIEIARQAGYDVNPADWLKTVDLSDAELESVSGGLTWGLLAMACKVDADQKD
jgi:predicted ribosomally synthesized peptide with nif11-like leader